MNAAAKSGLSPILRLALPALLLLPLFGATRASALYPPDGAKPDGAGGYMIPADGMCVIGVKADGTLLVDWSIANSRDCVAWTKSADATIDLVGMDTQAKCVNAGAAGNDGYRHTWSTSLCYDNVNKEGISRVDLDNTDAMCFALGGTVVTTGKCVAYGWVYRNRKADNELPVSGSGISTTDGVQSGDGLGFCSTSMRMTSATFTSAATCPSRHNSATLTPGEWPACASSTSGCQTQASYDAGLGWSWDSTSSRCLYAYGVKGPINAAATKADGTTYGAGSTQDLTLYTNQGDCLANGFAWDNWLPVTGTTTKTSADGGEFAGLPDGAIIRRLDALSSVEDGGGDFYSGTGAVCLKCHSDQSRAYQERNKPGFPKTRHRLAGDAIGKPFQPFFTAADSDWGLQGVECSMCHSTAKPARDDLIQVVPAGVVGPPAEGSPKSATGHNNTEYGTHLVDICYTCHGTAASPITDNPASVIPVAYGDFALTSRGLKPIANEFLNSPHAKYTGSSSKIDVGNKTKYGSSFEGYVCRSAEGKLRSTTYPNSTACSTAGFTWYTTAANGSFCYHSAASCAALPQGGLWVTSFDAVAYPFAADSGGPHGVCAGVGIGSILTTVVREGVAEKIPNPYSSLNEACTNTSDGSASSGASGFWVKDGEASAGGIPADTAQGNCMTCHDVHWALADTDPEAEPLRRECTTCHAKNLTLMRHPKGTGTPLEEMDSEPVESCETCHMPNKAHLFRISTDPAYSTFPSATIASTKANSTPDGTYTDASWVDVDQACGQCHGGGNGPAFASGNIAAGSSSLLVDTVTGFAVGERISVAGAGPLLEDGVSREALVSHILAISGNTLTLGETAVVNVSGGSVAQNPTKNGAAYLRKVQLAVRAKKIHGDKPIVRFGYRIGSPNTLTVNVNAARTICSTGTCNEYNWDWGDGSPGDEGVTASHTYAAGGRWPITLTVVEYGVNDGSLTKKVLATVPDYPPITSGSCGIDLDTWIATVTDTSSDDHPIAQVTVNWGDASVIASDTTAPFGDFTHRYRSAGDFVITHKAVDSAGQSKSVTCSVSPRAFSISGRVTLSDGSTAVPSATIAVMKNGNLVRTVFTDALGDYSVGNLKPGTYELTATRAGLVFASPSATTTVGASKTGVDIEAAP